MPAPPKSVNLKDASKPRTLQKNPLRDAKFRLAAHALKQLPADEGAEVVFAGRSNAGKSSALNTLSEQSALARVSKTPGRTQQLVVFDVTPETRLIDLPGYGFAKVPMDLRAHWGEVLSTYFAGRRSLKAALVFSDIRHPLTASDQEMLKLCEFQSIPVGLVLTKSDKLSRSAGLKVRDAVIKDIKSFRFQAEVFVFSALTKIGKDEVLGFVKSKLGFVSVP